MPLTHVAMWTNHGWQDITAENASAHSKVSAHSGLFMCKICKQYVTLAAGEKNKKHFRHRSGEPDKNCEDRSAYIPYKNHLSIEFTPPIRIQIIDNRSFRLKIGFILPTNDHFSGSFKIGIYGTNERIIYDFSRLRSDTLTYLDIGSKPASKYIITDSNDLFPGVVNGIREKGTLFDSINCKKIPDDADVKTNNGTTSDYANDEEIFKSSVFIIYNNYYNERKMKRIADVRNNLIIPFTADENLPYKFNNREYFNHKNGPETENYIGIWKWTAQKNWYKPESDYVTTEYVNYPYVSEVIIISECSTIDELIERLKNGLNVKYHSSCCILSIIQNDNSYRGIICNEENSSYVNGVLKLKAEEVAVDTIVFPPDNIIKLEERNVYKYISYESNIKRIPIIDIANTVKKAVLERITWAAFKAKGISRNTWKSVNDYIKELPTNDIISEIADIQHCSLNQAEEYYSKFMENADKYINGDNLELNAISYAIEHNQELSDRCKALLRDDWKNSYKSEVENVESQLAELKGAISEKRKELESIQSEKNKVQSELDAINNDIASKERLASNVEKRISEKISDAQKNAAEFISQMAFVNVGNNNRVRSNDYFTSGAAFESKSKEVYSDAKQMIELLSDNLECAGVMSQYSFPLSAYIAAAYINYFPLLIVGANANDIANAVSIKCYQCIISDCAYGKKQ